MAGTYARQTEMLVLGGGPAGYMAAIRLGQLGRSTVLVERRDLGGECLNRGCIPSKSLLHAAHLYRELTTQGPALGIAAEGVRFEMARAQAAKQAIVLRERQGVQMLLKSAGVQVLAGSARFTGPTSVELTAPDGGRERIDFTQALVATGAEPLLLPGFEPEPRKVVTPWELLDLEALPKSMLVLGGGVSGCELGQFAAEVGVTVGIVELMPQILPGLDPDLSRELTGTFEKMGIAVRTGTRAVRLERMESGIRLSVTSEKGAEELTADMLFLTVGKRPATRELGLEEAGVACDPRSGAIVVDAQQRTNVPNIYAAGDVGRPPMLAHKAYREGILAAEVMAGGRARYDFRAIPSVVFTVPEIASTGLTLSEAIAQGRPAREVRFPYAALGRAHAYHATEGWLKVVGEEGTGLLLGVHAIGHSSGEFAAEAALALEMGATVRDVAQTIHPHPTFSEMLQEAALLWLGEPMHVARRREPARPH
ncbi:MAG: dihydrolipoyl dehydrogenase [Thermoplasmata archaeon]